MPVRIKRISHASTPAIRTSPPRNPTGKRRLYEKDTVVRAKRLVDPAKTSALSFIDRTVGETAMLRRSFGPEGTKRLIVPHQRARLTALLQRSSTQDKLQWEKLLRSFKGENRQVARGLILRTLIAHADELGKNPATFKRIEDFADSLRKLDADTLLIKASVLDLDSTTNTNPKDVLALARRRGVIHAVDESDDQGDNDGLFQRFTASCGPTVLQMMIGEANPLAAFAIHDSALFSDSSTDTTADFQKKVLEDCKGVAIGRREAQLRARVRNGLGRLKRSQLITQAEADAFTRHWAQAAPKTKAANKALSVMRKRYDGFPSRDELACLIKASPMAKIDGGMNSDDLISALQTYLAPLTGVEYRQTTPEHGFARGQAWRHLDAVEKAVRQGIDIPVGIMEPGHWMLISHVKGRKPNRAYLVSDPDGGRTAWVTERSLVKGTFVAKQFNLCEKGERGTIDCFLLPKSE